MGAEEAWVEGEAERGGRRARALVAGGKIGKRAFHMGTTHSTFSVEEGDAGRD